MNLDIAAAKKRLRLAPHGLRTPRQKALADTMTAALAAEYAATLARRKPMTVMYVPYADVSRYEAMGWTRTDALRGTYHGEFAVLMIWEGLEEPAYDSV